MSDKYFLDTNVLLYAHDRLAGAKHQRALTLVEQLWSTGMGVLSTQVLQEFCATVLKKLTQPLLLDDTQRVVLQYLAWDVVVNRPTDVLDAIEIEAR